MDVTGNCALNVVEFLKSVQGDHTLRICLLVLQGGHLHLHQVVRFGGGARCDTSALVLREDAGVTGSLRGRSSSLPVVSLF